MLRGNVVLSETWQLVLTQTWEEHERQHARETKHDANLLEELDGLLVPGTHRRAHHYLAAAAERRGD